MSQKRLVWSDDDGDQRKRKEVSSQVGVNPKNVLLQVRRLTSGKGRTVIEIKGLPKNEKWCRDLSKRLKKALGVGGTYKNGYIEIHGEKLDDVVRFFDSISLKWKKTGG